MTIQARIVELEQQHYALEKKLAYALKHKSTDDLEIKASKNAVKGRDRTAAPRRRA